jgi:son of sevenless-like protein
MEGTKAMEFTDEVDATITRIHTRVKEWAGLGLLDSVLQSNKIKEGIDRFHRDIDACMMKFNVWISRSLFTMLFTLSRYQSTWNCIEVREIS